MKALIDLLAGRSPNPPLDGAQWRSLLALADRTLSTTLLGHAADAPAWFAEAVQERIAKNAIRRRRLLDAYQEIGAALTAARIEFVLLKGLTHETGFGIDPALRVQTDHDLLLPADQISAARSALIAAGYQPHHGEGLSENHIPPLFKPATWQWHGDYFDPAYPAVIELHHELWNPARDRVQAPGLADFWNRRVSLRVAGLDVSALEETDRLGFAALHLLRHVLANDFRPAHACELASALGVRFGDAAFWERWRRLHAPGLRRLQTIAFRLAALWFDRPLPAGPREEWHSMPASIRKWFHDYAQSPIENLTKPNKDTLWLHMALLPSVADRLAVARRRLIPMRLPRRGEELKRMRYHTYALARTVFGVIRRPKATASIASHISD